MSAVDAIPLLAAAGGDYQISRSVRLRSSASAYFNRTPASAGSLTTWTMSFWVKRGANTTYNTLADAWVSGSETGMWLQNDTIVFYNYGGFNKVTTQVLRDYSAWYHIVFVADTTNATAADRQRIYLNGSRVTTFSASTDATLNQATRWNQNSEQIIGNLYLKSTSGFDGYLTEVNFIDGQALTASSFGETDAVTGVWKPKKYAGTYGTNGFYLNFSDNSAATAAAIGKDYSGNGNNWTPNNISVTAGVTYDSMVDVPTMWADGNGGRGNYCTLNPLSYGTAGTSLTVTNGNLQSDSNRTAASNWINSTIGLPTSGKWYCEVSSTAGTTIGILDLNTPRQNAAPSNFRGYYGVSGNKGSNGTYTAYGATFTNTDVIGIAVDMDAGTIVFYKNNTSQGTAFSDLLSSGVSWCFGAYYSGNPTNTTIWNFGQRPFAYTPPTGFKALNTQNLPEATIKKGNAHFDTLLWTSTATVKDVTGSNFQPDLVWVKSRASASANEGYHHLVDAVRGAGKVLSSNVADAEYWTGTNNSVQAFLPNGFTAGDSDGLNGNAMVSWLWKESVTAGFDIVTYTGTGANTTIAHNLGVKPSLIIIKPRSAANPWSVYHASVGATKYLLLNATDAAATNATFMNNTEPTSSVFSLGSGTYVNTNGVTHVAYLFAEVAGFSAFGKYTGNGSADGPFVYCGFRPRYILLKRTDTAPTNWVVIDTATATVNVSAVGLIPNLSNAEFASNILDILSNGFKLRSTGAGENASGGTYIFAAFAENPFKNSLAR